MNKAFNRTLIVCSSIFGAIALAVLASGDKDSGAVIGLTALILSLIYLIVGIVLVIIKQTRNIGMGLLLTAGIMLLVGFAVCSLAPFHMNTH